MMSLRTYYDEHVRIVDTNGRVFIGVVDDYFFPEDNENGFESIVIKTTSGDCYEFTEESIVEIAIM